MSISKESVLMIGKICVSYGIKYKVGILLIGSWAKLLNIRRPAGVIGSVFSRTGFTDAAVTLASFTMPQAILLWGGGEIEIILEEERIRSFLVSKLRRCIETGSPNYNIKTDIL